MSLSKLFINDMIRDVIYHFIALSYEASKLDINEIQRGP